MAQEKKGGVNDFMKDELEDFNQFISKENQAFISFLREPWKELNAEKPVEKRVKPEPVKPIVYDEKTAPKDTPPVCLQIEEILDLTTEEGKQRPSIKVNDVDNIVFDNPDVIIKKKDPTVKVITMKEPAKPAVTPPVEKPKPAVPAVKPEPERKPEPTVKQEPLVKPVQEVKPEPKPEPPKVVAIPEVKPEPPKPQPVPTPKPAPAGGKSSPLYAGGSGRTALSFGGENFYVSNALRGACRLTAVDENSIANAYEALCKTDYQPLLKDCKEIKKALALNDWGYFTLLNQVSDSYTNNADASVVMQLFLLNESGYKVKMARQADNNKMLLFASTDCQIYGHPYTTINGQRYYSMNSTKAAPFYMCQKDFPKASNLISMRINHALQFEGSTKASTHQAKGSAARVTLSVPTALMDFYKKYPQCDYSVYFNAPVNNNIASPLLSTLSGFTQGKSEKEAANLLINFVQTGFEYKTDDEQFGYEKPFFVEELFYYPFCDCEDRSMLFSYLIRKLMKLDVVLLDYPDHIATAVCFNEPVEGDYVMVGGKKYTVCDPTYIGASIGMTMPQYKSVAAKVLKY
jgi:hypothetical protein